MTTPNTPMTASVYAQRKIILYNEAIGALVKNNFNFRAKLLEQDRIYARELDWTDAQRRAQQANLTGDSSKMQNVTIPVVGPQVDSATSYFVEMFLTSYPIFPVVSDPDNIDAGVQLETILGQSAIYFQWARHISMCFRDGLKHNIQALEVDWATQKVPSVVNDAQRSVGFGVPEEIVFSGNKLKRIDPYNLIFDQRVPIAEIHTRGEFVGYTELITRIELKQLFLDLDKTLTMNATEAFQSGTGVISTEISQTGTYYIPQVNPKAFMNPAYTSQNWLQWANIDTAKKIQYSDMYEKKVLYARIIPKEFGLFGKAGTKNPGDPQIFKFIIINNKVCIFVQRMTNAHNMLPIIIGQMNEDGLGLQTKSYADNAAPFQFLASALYNSGIQSQRRKVYDRLIYDPSRINKADIDKADPVARIPIKTEGYGKPLGEAVYQIPFRDDGVPAILGMAREIVDMADVSTGQNRAQRGQFQKGNKTRHEFDTVMGNSDARPRTSAILLGVGWFGPIKEILKFNILQYQPPETLFNRNTKRQVKVNPTDLRKVSWEFQLADGIMPSDKFLDPQLFGQVLQYASAVPAAASEWDLSGMFAYQLKSQGARWVDNFRRTPQQQQQYLTQLQASQQQTQPGMPPPTIPVSSTGANPHA